jgi:UDP-N-acetylmuramoyl-L-alanyl-D-glutamate--2,6-diaminopimelate ligase
MHEILSAMRLSEVILGTGARGGLGDDPQVVRVTGDSRQVVPGALFFALPGARLDGHDFAAEAARRGAVAVVAERPVECAPALLLLAPSSRRAMSLAAAALHGNPALDLTLAGVTGTNGKTTVSYLVEACVLAAGIPAGVIGTITHRFPGVERPASHTTPESTEIQALLAEMRTSGARLVVLEVSSHALAQERVAGLHFAVAGFTNLTRDHLDYHGDMDGYFSAKRRLFTEHLAPEGIAVVNARDPWGSRLADQIGPGRQVWRYGTRTEDTLGVEGLALSLAGVTGMLRTPRGPVELRSPLVGLHNLENLLCAAGMALALGVPPEAVARGLALCRGAPGRLERIDGPGFSVFVDYAHTDDALTRVLGALRALSPSRLLTVFGCGGDRDRGKRPLMGEAAGRASDLCVVTSDNPRGEDPRRIIDEILPGLERAGRRRLGAAQARAGQVGYLVEPDRRVALALALACAREGDAVLVAGKGHETYQEVGQERHHFDDREEARRALRPDGEEARGALGPDGGDASGDPPQP